MKWKYAAVLASFLMVATAFAVLATAEDNAPTAPVMSNLDKYLQAKEDLAQKAEQGVVPTNAPEDMFSYTDGPYPIYADNGAPPEVQVVPPWGSH